MYSLTPFFFWCSLCTCSWESWTVVWTLANCNWVSKNSSHQSLSAGSLLPPPNTHILSTLPPYSPLQASKIPSLLPLIFRTSIPHSSKQKGGEGRWQKWDDRLSAIYRASLILLPLFILSPYPQDIGYTFWLWLVMQIDPLSHHSALQIQRLKSHIFVNCTRPCGEDVVAGGQTRSQIHSEGDACRWPLNGCCSCRNHSLLSSLWKCHMILLAWNT